MRTMHTAVSGRLSSRAKLIIPAKLPVLVNMTSGVKMTSTVAAYVRLTSMLMERLTSNIGESPLRISALLALSLVT